MKFRLNIFLLLSLLFIVSCDSLVDSTDNSVSGNWSIPVEQVFDGGPGRDGIPAVDNPEFAALSDVNYLKDDDLVIAVKFGQDVKIYPHRILDQHEIVNDELNGHKFAVTYCPLTGTGITWNRVIEGTPTTFGVSGLLYNANLIPYDRNTNSNWSQMLLESVNGELIGTKIETYLALETTWSQIQQIYPAAKVLTTNTGYSKDYSFYPYGDYKTNHDKLIFPVSFEDGRLLRKERVLGVLNQSAKAYWIKAFGDGIKLVNDSIGGKNIIVAGSTAKNFAVAFEKSLSGSNEKLTFAPVQNSLPIIMTDNLGNKYDIFGKVVEGPAIGNSLKPVTNYMSYWFAWAAFYPTTELYRN
jgi:hypothetical protein